MTFAVFLCQYLCLKKVFWNNLLGIVCEMSVCMCVCVLEQKCVEKNCIFTSETEPRRRQCEHYPASFGQFPRKMCSHENCSSELVGLDQNCQTSDEAHSDRKKTGWELIACRLHSRWLKAEELCTPCVSVSPFRWPDCRVFVSAATQSTESQWNPTLSLLERLFPKLRLDFFTRCSVTLGGPERRGVY